MQTDIFSETIFLKNMGFWINFAQFEGFMFDAKSGKRVIFMRSIILHSKWFQSE